MGRKIGSGISKPLKAKENVKIKLKQGQRLFYCNCCDNYFILTSCRVEINNKIFGWKVRSGYEPLFGKSMWSYLLFARCINCASVEIKLLEDVEYEEIKLNRYG